MEGTPPADIFKAYDIRGLYGEEIDGDAAELIARGFARVLSALGRDDTAERWYESDHGPRTPLSHAAPANCTSCGFFVPLSGSLGRVFGAEMIIE